MLNAPHNSLFDSAAGSGADKANPAIGFVRIYGTGIVFALLLIVVLGRIAWLQVFRADTYRAALETTTVEYEIIPARDGRILTDTTVLATDVERYDIQIHYRWLESPPSEQWLNQEVRRQLTREERRDPALVDRVKFELLERRNAMHQAVAIAAGMSPEELQERCEGIQRNVERIARIVNQAHHGSQAESGDPETEDDGVLMQWASAVRRALTTPPRRETLERIVVREEESFHPVAAAVSLQVAAQIAEHPEQYPGVRPLARTTRSYPESRLAAHMVGARTLLKDDDPRPELPVDGRIDGELTLRAGRFGVERSYNEQLSGRPGLRRIVRNRRQQVMTDEIIREPISGRDLVLTIDTRLQQVCEQLLREALADAPLQRLLPRDDDDRPRDPQPVPVGGSVVVLEAATGRVLAAASAPDFSLDLFTGGSAADWESSNSDPRRPFVTRFTGMALPPGSTFKVLTAIAALESGTVTADSRMFCQGYLNRPDEHRCLIYRLYNQGHNHIGIQSALAQSCNVFFFDAAQRMGMRTLVDWTERLRFGHPTGVDLPFEKGGTVPAGPREIQLTSTAGSSALEREALGLAIGQSRLTVTPLQMARLMAVIANGGWLVTPHVVSEEGVSRTAVDASAVPRTAVRQRIPEIHRESIDIIRAGLKSTVSSPAGTGYRDVRTPEISIAGKTGTAETAPEKPDHAWFAGYVPADDPQFVIVVVLEHGGSGSHAAGPIAREVARAL